MVLESLKKSNFEILTNESLKYVTGGMKTAGGSYIKKTVTQVMTIDGVTRSYTRDFYTNYSSDFDDGQTTCYYGETDGGYSRWY